jgi:hypothetical protein
MRQLFVVMYAIGHLMTQGMCTPRCKENQTERLGKFQKQSPAASHDWTYYASEKKYAGLTGDQWVGYSVPLLVASPLLLFFWGVEKSVNFCRKKRTPSKDDTLSS